MAALALETSNEPIRWGIS